MLVEVIRPWGRFSRGLQLERPPGVANLLVRNGYVRPVELVAETAPATKRRRMKRGANANSRA